MLERERAEKEGLIAEFKETRKQLEEDVDREIEELKEKYEAKLATEREAALRLKGENAYLRRRFFCMLRDCRDQAGRNARLERQLSKLPLSMLGGGDDDEE